MQANRVGFLIRGVVLSVAILAMALPVFGQVAFQTSFPNSIIRPEGKTEQLGPIVFQSTSLGAGRTISAGSTITITFNATVTNTVGTGITLTCNIASLYVAPPAPPAAPTTPSCGSAVAPITQITGSATGTTNVFTIAFPAGAATTFAAGDSLTVSGVRIDATLVGPSANVTATISGNSSAPSTNPITFTATQANVATTAAQTLSVAISGNAANILTCAIGGAGGAPISTFSVKATEKVLAGFTMAADEPGSTVGVTANVIITGVPSGLTVTPTATTIGGTGATLTFVALPSPILSTGSTQVMTFAYVVATDNVGSFESATFNFTLGLPSGNTGLITAINTVNTVTAQVSLAGSTAAAGILRFGTNVQPATPIPVATIGDCVTYLLFPFITTQASYDTIINISNSSNALGGNAQGGPCTLSFYSTLSLTAATVGNNPVSFPMATTAAPATAVIVPAGGTFSFQASTVTALAGTAGTGLSGYLFAKCGFLDAHGFSWFMNGTSPTTAAYSSGFLALVIQSPVGNRQNAAGQFESLTN